MSLIIHISMTKYFKGKSDLQMFFFILVRVTIEFGYSLSIGNQVLYKRGLDGDDSYLKLIIKFRVFLTPFYATF